jgi:hypothetical protein
MPKIRACFSLLDCARAPVTVRSPAPAATRAKFPAASPAARCSPKLSCIAFARLRSGGLSILLRPSVRRSCGRRAPRGQLLRCPAMAPPRRRAASLDGPRSWRYLVRSLRVSHRTAAPPRPFSVPAPACFGSFLRLPCCGERSEEQRRWRPCSETEKK